MSVKLPSYSCPEVSMDLHAIWRPIITVCVSMFQSQPINASSVLDKLRSEFGGLQIYIDDDLFDPVLYSSFQENVTMLFAFGSFLGIIKNKYKCFTIYAHIYINHLPQEGCRPGRMTRKGEGRCQDIYIFLLTNQIIIY